MKRIITFISVLLCCRHISRIHIIHLSLFKKITIHITITKNIEMKTYLFHVLSFENTILIICRCIEYYMCVILWYFMNVLQYRLQLKIWRMLSLWHRLVWILAPKVSLKVFTPITKMYLKSLDFSSHSWIGSYVYVLNLVVNPLEYTHHMHLFKLIHSEVIYVWIGSTLFTCLWICPVSIGESHKSLQW